MALVIYEQAPLWHALFTALGFEVHFSRQSNRATYEKGQFTIPSDTVCYPAKLMHGHVMELLEDGIETIFYPELTYNVDEGASSNHYNCPVVAYYGEVLEGNLEELEHMRFLHPPLGLDSQRELVRTLLPCLRSLDGTITRGEVKKAVAAGFAAYEGYKTALRREGEAPPADCAGGCARPPGW